MDALHAAQGSRGLAAAAAQEVKLPPQHSIAGRYAAALYLAAAKAGKLEGVEGELAQVTTIITESTDFHNFIHDPSVPTKRKTEGLAVVLDKLGASDLTKNFMSELLHCHYYCCYYCDDELLELSGGRPVCYCGTLPWQWGRRWGCWCWCWCHGQAAALCKQQSSRLEHRQRAGRRACLPRLPPLHPTAPATPPPS